MSNNIRIKRNSVAMVSADPSSLAEGELAINLTANPPHLMIGSLGGSSILNVGPVLYSAIADPNAARNGAIWINSSSHEMNFKSGVGWYKLATENDVISSIASALANQTLNSHPDVDTSGVNLDDVLTYTGSPPLWIPQPAVTVSVQSDIVVNSSSPAQIETDFNAMDWTGYGYPNTYLTIAPGEIWSFTWDYDDSSWLWTGGNGTFGMGSTPATISDFAPVAAGTGTRSMVTDNADGTYTHDDGTGLTIEIDTNADTNPFNPAFSGLSPALLSTNVQDALDELHLLYLNVDDNTSSVVDNADGTYTHDDGTGTTVVIDTNKDLNDLDDVNAGSPSNDQALSWNNGAGEWQPKTLVGIGNWITGNNGGDYASAPTATGSNALAIGNSATCPEDDGIAIGTSANVTSGANKGISIGDSSDATEDQSLAIGYLAQATQVGTVAIGDQAAASTAGSIAIGDGSSASGTASIGIGNGATASGENGICIGSKTAGAKCIRLGDGGDETPTATEHRFHVQNGTDFGIRYNRNGQHDITGDNGTTWTQQPLQAGANVYLTSTSGSDQSVSFPFSTMFNSVNSDVTRMEFDISFHWKVEASGNTVDLQFVDTSETARGVNISNVFDHSGAAGTASLETGDLSIIGSLGTETYGAVKVYGTRRPDNNNWVYNFTSNMRLFNTTYTTGATLWMKNGFTTSDNTNPVYKFTMNVTGATSSIGSRMAVSAKFFRD